MFGDNVDPIYPTVIEIMECKNKAKTSASYLNIYIYIDCECRLRTKLYEKRDDFNFPIVNFPFTCSNISAIPTHELYIYIYIYISRFISKAGVSHKNSVIEDCC